jgi:Xaa-Pro aminopeptidase
MLHTAECERMKYVDAERIRSVVDGGPYDAVVAMAPENVPYFSGFYNMDLRIIPERLHLAIWPRGGDPAFVVMERRAGQLTPRDAYVSDVRGYQGEGMDSMRAVVDVLRDRGISGGVIGIEGRAFPAGHLLDLRTRLPELEFKDAYAFLESIRVVKTPAERETLARVNHITERAIETAFRAAKPGDTERSVAARMQYEFLLGGGEIINAPLLASGDRGGIWHGLPTDRKIEPGMLFKTDFGGFLDGYYSDIAREAVMGKASPHQRGMHAKVTEVKHRIVDAMKPGVLASDLARLGRSAYDDLGIEFKWMILGHSIGLAIHEAPQIYTYVDEPLQAGMMMMIEVGYNVLGEESFHVEDLVEVTENGARYVTDAKAHEQLWEIG